MMRKRAARLKLAPFSMSQTKCEAVEALPPFPQTKMRAPLDRAPSRSHSMACPTLSEIDGFDGL